MIVFGLTGGIACGKSTVASRMREDGVALVDADQVARDVVAPGCQGLAAIARSFGPEVLAADGRLDRARLREIVFAAPEARQRLNALLHPLIAAETAERLAALEAEGVALACYEAALLVENGLADRYRPLVVVALPASLQLQRLMARDGISNLQAQQILDAQLPLAAKVAVADHVIDNSGGLTALRSRTDEIVALIREREASVS